MIRLGQVLVVLGMLSLALFMLKGGLPEGLRHAVTSVPNTAYLGGSLTCVLLGIFGWFGRHIENWYFRGGSHSLLLCRKATSHDQLRQVHAIATQLIGANVSSINSMKEWTRAYSDAFHLIVRKKGSTLAASEEVVGYFGVLPLTGQAMKRLQEGRITASLLEPSDIAKRGRCACVYIGGIAAKGARAQNFALSSLVEHLTTLSKRTSFILTRPVTPAGLRITRQYAFRCMDGADPKLDTLCMSTTGSLSAEAPSAKRPAKSRRSKAPAPDIGAGSRVESCMAPTSEYDLFISHASEDKASAARPLYDALRQHQLRIWFDEAELTLGDSLRRNIDDGLARCRFGIVILSPSFFAKEWPQRELDGLFARETTTGMKAIIPVWHGLDQKEMERYSPLLADRLAANTQEGIENVVEKVLRAVSK